MKLAIMQPYFFPYLGYFQLINAVDKYILYYRLNFIKEAWMNRNLVLNAGSGKPIHIFIPVVDKSSNKMINEVRIYNDFIWREKLLKTIFLNYKKAPFFDEVYPFLESIINKEFEYLYDFNNYSIIEIARHIGIETPIITDEGYFDELETNILNAEFSLISDGEEPIPLKVLRIFEICKYERANTFYNAIGGQKLYDKELFKKKNIDLGFIEMGPIIYKQFDHDFTPNLSIIDIMMFNSANNIQQMLNIYKII